MKSPVHTTPWLLVALLYATCLAIAAPGASGSAGEDEASEDVLLSTPSAVKPPAAGPLLPDASAPASQAEALVPGAGDVVVAPPSDGFDRRSMRRSFFDRFSYRTTAPPFRIS